MVPHQLHTGHRPWSSSEIHEGLLAEWKGNRSAADTADCFMKADLDSHLISCLAMMSINILNRDNLEPTFNVCFYKL